MITNLRGNNAGKNLFPSTTTAHAVSSHVDSKPTIIIFNPSDLIVQENYSIDKLSIVTLI
jgi:hypothetical protein